MLRPLSLSAWLGLAAAATAVPRVAVVGAGINGGSAVHFLRDLLGDGVDITVFEANREPGGRTLTRSFANVTVDVGGTAIYSRNRYVSGFARDFGLQPQAEDDGVNSDIGIWDGRKFRIQVDSDSRLDMGAKLLVRYGFSPLHVIPAVRNAVDGFDKIYDLQEGQKSFETPAAMLEALGVFNLTQTSAYDFFKSLGVEEMFVKEMVDRASRCNYNQPGTMNSFADLISLAGVGVAGHVFGLANGTQAISRGLLRSASRVHLGEHVVKVASHGTGYLVQTTQRSEQFDGVILATPLELAAIQLPAEAKRGIGRGRKYQRTYVTFVHGEINETYFGLKEGAKTKKVPGTILTTEDSSSPFSSFGVHKVFPDGSMVVKLFSRRDLHDSDIQPLFPRVFATFKYVWAAYPKLQPLARENWASFRLDGHALFYTSGLETGASAMEVAAIAGRNGALLMREALQRQDRRAKESKEEVLRMHHKVHSKPLLIEQAYDFGRVFKQSGHL